MGDAGGNGGGQARGVRKWVIRRVRGLVGAGVAAAYCVLAFGWAWRAGGAGMSDLESILAFGALVVQAFAFHTGIALVGLALVSVIFRMPRTLLALVPALVWTIGPAVWSCVRPLPDEPQGETLSVFSANILYRNDRAADLISQIDASDPDIVVLQEFAPGLHDELERLLRDRYPHARTWPQSDAFGQAVFSRLAFVEEPTLWWVGERARVPQLEFEVEFGGRRIGVWNVHPLPPSGRDLVREQRGMVIALARRAADRMASDDAPDALVLAGDFNAPFGTGHLRELRVAGLRDAHRVAGRGRGATWSPGGVLGWAPGIDLDHVTWRGSLRPVGAGVGERFGSDHRPVWAEFVVE